MFFPIKDNVPTVRKPILTIALIVINTVIFLFSMTLGREGFQWFTVQYGYIPFEFWNSVELTPNLPVSTYFTMISSMFMHGGWMHLIGNMLFLWIYGNNVEDYFGRVRFILFYLFAGFMAIGLFTLFGPNSQIPLVGASGAIAGVMGAYMVLYPKAKVTVLIVFFFIQFVELPAKLVLGMWFAYQLLMVVMSSSSGGGVAWMAHVGGFLFGYGLLKIMMKFKGNKPQASDGQRIYRVTWR